MNIEIEIEFSDGEEPTVEVAMEETVPTIQVELSSNPDFRKFHTNFEMSRIRIEYFTRPLGQRSEEKLSEIGKKGATLVRRLFRIPGVIEIFVQPYSLGIEKGKCFNWDDLQPQIIEAIFKSAPKPRS